MFKPPFSTAGTSPRANLFKAVVENYLAVVTAISTTLSGLGVFNIIRTFIERNKNVIASELNVSCFLRNNVYGMSGMVIAQIARIILWVIISLTFFIDVCR